jgi:hypothetical protein
MDTDDEFRIPFPETPPSMSDSYRLADGQISYDGHRNFCFLPPLAWLLYRMNSPSVPMADRDAAAKAALPYCHEKVPEAVTTPVPFDIGRLASVNDVLKAQRKVAQAMAQGQMSLNAGKQWLEALAIIAKSYDLAILGDRVAELEETIKARSRDQGAPSLVVIDGDMPG